MTGELQISNNNNNSNNKDNNASSNGTSPKMDGESFEELMKERTRVSNNQDANGTTIKT
jgi:hypothetical protein